MKATYPPLSLSGDAFNPVLAAFHEARAALRVAQAAERTRPPSRWRSAPLLASQDLLRARTGDLLRERGKALAALIGAARPFVPSHGFDPPFLKAVYPFRSAWFRLADHETLYQLAGSRGPANARDTLLVTEPYLPDEQVPAALAHWTEKLALAGLAVRQLDRCWLTHAPDNEHSQIFFIGSSSLI